MGGIIIGYEIGKILKKETIFCERVKGKFTLRRGFSINKGAKVLIVEDVITTGKSSMECLKLIKNAKANLVGFAAIIDRSTKKIQGALVDVLSVLANNNNLNLVLAKSQVILVGKDIDLTDKAITELNKVLPKVDLKVQ